MSFNALACASVWFDLVVICTFFLCPAEVQHHPRKELPLHLGLLLAGAAETDLQESLTQFWVRIAVSFHFELRFLVSYKQGTHSSLVPTYYFIQLKDMSTHVGKL